MVDIPPVQTHIRKITVGTPVRKVTGAQAQTLGDLTDVDVTNLSSFSVLQFNNNTGKFEVTTDPDGLTFDGGTF